MKKILLSIGSLVTIATPVVAVVSCGDDNKQGNQGAVSHLTESQTIAMGYNLLTLGKLADGFKDVGGGQIAPVDRENTDADGTTSPNPVHNIIKALDPTLTHNGNKGGFFEKSLNDTWPAEIKWWMTSYAYAMSWGLHNNNKIGADSDWDGDKGAALGVVAKEVIDRVFPKTATAQRASFVEWADRFIAHRAAVQAGASAYDATQKSLAKEYVEKFGVKAIELSLNFAQVWKARWNQVWGEFDAKKFMKVVAYDKTDAELKEIVSPLGTTTRVARNTQVEPAAILTNTNAGNRSTNTVQIPAGLYKDIPSADKDGHLSSSKIAGATIMVTSKPASDDTSTWAAGSATVTLEGGPWSGANGVTTDNWANQATGPVKMIFVKKAGNDPVFVREDALMADTNLTGATAADKAADLALKANANFDAYGKTPIWMANTGAITSPTAIAAGSKLWTIADFGMYFNLGATTLAAWTTADGEELKFESKTDFQNLIDKAVELLSAEFKAL